MLGSRLHVGRKPDDREGLCGAKSRGAWITSLHNVESYLNLKKLVLIWLQDIFRLSTLLKSSSTVKICVQMKAAVAGIGSLNSLAQLTHLSLAQLHVTSHGLSQLTGLSNVRILRLQKSMLNNLRAWPIGLPEALKPFKQLLHLDVSLCRWYSLLCFACEHSLCRVNPRTPHFALSLSCIGGV